MNVIIRCAGQGERWNDFLSVPKHLAPLCGEPVLHRAVRLVNELSDAEVRIVVEDTADDRYKVPGARRVQDKPTGMGDVDKIASSERFWSDDDRTVTLFGDVWWHRDTLAEVLSAEVDGWRWWGRMGPNGAGGELFALVHTAEANDEISAACEQVGELHRTGGLERKGHNGRPARGGWALYRTLSGKDVGDHGNHGNLTIVDEPWTQDMDSPRDWDEWCLMWAETPTEDRPV